jgi:hypothetical protein
MYECFRKNIGRGIVALALVALVGLATVRLTTSAFPVVAGVTQRLPALDNRIICGWLGNEKVVTGIPDRDSLLYSEMQEPQEIFDLDDRTRRPTPTLPKLSEDEKGDYSSDRSNPFPSPDGQWLLYTESAYRNNKILFKRWRLVHPDGTGTQLLAFPASAEFLYPHWLADSSGWLANTDYLIRINGRHLTQTRFSPPENSGDFDLLLGGEIIFAQKWRIEPQRIIYKSNSLNTPASVQNHFLRLPWGQPAFAQYGYGGSFPFDFSRDGRFLIVRTYLPSSDNKFLTWLQKAVPGRDAGYIFWRIPRDGGSPERLPLPSDACEYSLSPDGRKILYWRNVSESGTQTYLLTLTGK